MKANPPLRPKPRKPAPPIDPLPEPPGYGAWALPPDLRARLAAGGYDDALKALERLKRAGCDESDLLERCWVAAWSHEENFRLSPSARRIGDPRNFYGEEPEVLRALPEKLRKLATTIDKVNVVPSMRQAFVSSMDLTDVSHVARIVSIPNQLRQYADAVEKAYKWAARNLASEFFNPSSFYEWCLIAFIREKTGRTKRLPFGNIAQLLDAMVDIRLGADRAKYKTKIEGEYLRKRFERYSRPKEYRRMVADITEIQMGWGWPSQRLSEARALEKKVLEKLRILGFAPPYPARRRRSRDR